MFALAYLVKANWAIRPPLHAYLQHPAWRKVWLHVLDMSDIHPSDEFAALRTMKPIEEQFMISAGVGIETDATQGGFEWEQMADDYGLFDEPEFSTQLEATECYFCGYQGNPWPDGRCRACSLPSQLKDRDRCPFCSSHQEPEYVRCDTCRMAFPLVAGDGEIERLIIGVDLIKGSVVSEGVLLRRIGQHRFRVISDEVAPYQLEWGCVITGELSAHSRLQFGKIRGRPIGLRINVSNDLLNDSRFKELRIVLDQMGIGWRLNTHTGEFFVTIPFDIQERGIDFIRSEMANLDHSIL